MAFPSLPTFPRGRRILRRYRRCGQRWTVPPRALRAGNILRFAKAAAVGIDPEAAAELENYCYVWNVGRRDWQKPFENHPGGFQAEFSPEDTARLERINGVRSRVILPLERFRRELREADGPGFSTAVYHLLESIGAAEHIEALCRGRRTGGGTAAAAGRTGSGLGGADEPAGHPGGGDRTPTAAAAGAGKPSLTAAPLPCTDCP